MKIAHVFPEGNFGVTKSFNDFLCEYFDKNHNVYITCNKEAVPSFIEIGDNIEYIESADILNIVAEHDKIILHSLYTLSQHTIIQLMKNKSVFDKIYWVSWGADMYNWNVKLGRRPKTIIRNIKRNILMYNFIKTIKYYVAIFPGDVPEFKKRFGKSAKTFSTNYLAFLNSKIADRKYTDSILDNIDNSENGMVCVQVGHQANPVLKHIKTLKILKGCMDDTTHIYIPLSYGDKENAKKVQKYVKNNFESNVFCLNDYMPPDEYNKFLEKMDVAIYNTKRQIALYNILYMLCLGKTIYFDKKSITYKYFRSIGIDVFDFSKINKTNIKRNANRDKIYEYMDSTYGSKEYLISSWQNIFID